jgi:hypothetical protein
VCSSDLAPSTPISTYTTTAIFSTLTAPTFYLTIIPGQAGDVTGKIDIVRIA